MGKIILNIAISLDGYISDKDGGFEWILGQDDDNMDTGAPFDFENFIKNIDILVMGSKSYEDVILSGLDSWKSKKVIVATTRLLKKKENIEFISGDICEYIDQIKENSDKNIWIFGGANLADQFIQRDLIDQYIIAIIPTILGKGRKLFSKELPTIKLHLDAIEVNDGITVMTYTKR